MAKLMNIGFGNMVPGKRAGDFDRRDAGKKNQERDFY